MFPGGILLASSYPLRQLLLSLLPPRAYQRQLVQTGTTTVTRFTHVQEPWRDCRSAKSNPAPALEAPRGESVASFSAPSRVEGSVVVISAHIANQET